MAESETESSKQGIYHNPHVSYPDRIIHPCSSEKIKTEKSPINSPSESMRDRSRCSPLPQKAGKGEKIYLRKPTAITDSSFNALLGPPPLAAPQGGEKLEKRMPFILYSWWICPSTRSEVTLMLLLKRITVACFHYSLPPPFCTRMPCSSSSPYNSRPRICLCTLPLQLSIDWFIGNPSKDPWKISAAIPTSFKFHVYRLPGTWACNASDSHHVPRGKVQGQSAWI